MAATALSRGRAETETRPRANRRFTEWSSQPVHRAPAQQREQMTTISINTPSTTTPKRGPAAPRLPRGRSAIVLAIAVAASTIGGLTLLGNGSEPQVSSTAVDTDANTITSVGAFNPLDPAEAAFLAGYRYTAPEWADDDCRNWLPC